MREPWTILVSLTLLGCASAPPTPSADAAPAQVEEVSAPMAGNSDLICTTARATGSHIATRRCVSRTEQDAISKASQEWMRTGGTRGSPYVVPDSADPRVDESDLE